MSFAIPTKATPSVSAVFTPGGRGAELLDPSIFFLGDGRERRAQHQRHLQRAVGRGDAEGGDRQSDQHDDRREGVRKGSAGAAACHP
jgi:hypothetical protein